ncbi:MAG: biopolymer transporter Tol [Bacteroidota bacterium]
MKTIYIFLILIFISTLNTFAQFGQNRIKYKEFDWLYIQTTHFDIYFTQEGSTSAEFAAKVAEEALDDIQKRLNFKINSRISLIIYNSHNDFQETNTTDSYLGQGTGGFTEPFKNRVVFPFEGSFQKFRHVLHHELVHAVMRDMLYGGTVQNIIAKGITLQLPHWYHEGMAEYLSTGWETNSDQFIRNAIINEFMPDINQLSGYFGYRGGQSVFRYIAEKYGDEKLGELLSNSQGLGGVEEAFKASVGLTLEELNERWKKDLKVRYWPEIASRLEPDDFAQRLTNNKKDGGFYNTSPVISPMGDKVAFISDRDVYLDVYVMDILNDKKVKKVASSGTTHDFEELNVLFPALTWAPDNKRIALSLKSGGFDVITVIDVEKEKSNELPVRMDGIENVNWSPDGSKIAFVGATASQSDIYVYDFTTQKTVNITEDIFSDYDPIWSPDGKKIAFSSDRKSLDQQELALQNLTMLDVDYHYLDLYEIDIKSKSVIRLTDWEFSDERSALYSPDGKTILFVSDKNGINNIYRKSLLINFDASASSVISNQAVPITNSLNEISQISISKDGKKLTFTSLFKAGYNIFLIDNPFEMKVKESELEMTTYMKALTQHPDSIRKEIALSGDAPDSVAVAAIKEDESEEDEDTEKEKSNIFFTGELIAEEKSDSTLEDKDYSSYIFGSEDISIDTTKKTELANTFIPKLDDDGNYLVNRYKVSFTPDLIYANAGWSTLYGLLGTTVLSFSDVLGNHRLIGVTSMQVDLKNSDYGLAYYYLASRINFGIEGFHTARFVYLNRGFGSDLFRFRNFGLIASANYPINRFYRLDGSLSLMDVSSENLDNFFEPKESTRFIIPSLNFVHDNTMWGYYSPIQGERYNITGFGNPDPFNKKTNFYSLIWDYRRYFRFWYDNSFVIRLSGGLSGGPSPQRFFIGGTENWINRSFATNEIPLENAADFAFLTPALPLRGYDYAEQIGTKYSLLNLELRMPLIRYLVTGVLPLFFQNILGAAFIDMGSAWNNSKELRLFTRDEYGNRLTDDLLIGTGFGTRFYFLFALVRFDVAWKYNVDSFSKPRYYFSLGTDF